MLTGVLVLGAKRIIPWGYVLLSEYKKELEYIKGLKIIITIMPILFSYTCKLKYVTQKTDSTSESRLSISVT